MQVRLNLLRSQRIAKRFGKENRSVSSEDLCPYIEIVKLRKKTDNKETKQLNNVPVQSYPKVSEIQKWS